MKNLYALFILLLTLPALAQVPDFSVTDCNNNSKSLHQVLSQGKVVVLASEGLDCSICVQRAPGLQNFASQNSAGIEVWGAMTYTYSNNTPDCAAVNNWVNNHNWTDIFAFIDTNEDWFMGGTPSYYVFDPKDSSLAYQGFSESTALQTAQSLVSTVGLSSNRVKDFAVNAVNGYLEFSNGPAGYWKVQVVSLTGKLVRSGMVSTDQRMSVAGLTPGVYLVNAEDGKGFQAVRKIYIK